MLWLDATSDELAFRRRRRASLLAPMGLACWFVGCLPLAAGWSARLIPTVLLWAAGALLLYRGFPRRGAGTSVVIDLKAKTVTTDGAARPLSTVRHVELSGEVLRDEDGFTQLEYRAELVFEDGRRLVVLSARDPARVISGVRVLKESTGMRVVSGWGLPQTVWDQQPSEQTPADIRTVPHVPHRGVGLAAIIGGTAEGIAMTFMFVNRIEKGAEISVLSWVLAIATVGAVILMGFTIRARGHRLKIGDHVEVQRTVFGVPWRRELVTSDRWLGTFLVSPTGNAPGHILALAAQDAASIPWNADDTERLQSEYRLQAPVLPETPVAD